MTVGTGSSGTSVPVTVSTVNTGAGSGAGLGGLFGGGLGGGTGGGLGGGLSISGGTAPSGSLGDGGLGGAMGGRFSAAFGDSPGQSGLAMLNGREVIGLSTSTEPGITRHEDSTMSWRLDDGSLYSMAFSGIAFLPEGLPGGVYPNSDGSLFVVYGDLGIDAAVAPANLSGFLQEIGGMGYIPSLEAKGKVVIDLGNAEKFSGVFAYDDLRAATGDCTDVSIREVPGAVNSADLRYQLVCDNGVVQNITPAILDSGFYLSMIEQDLTVGTDRDGGFVHVSGVGVFRPSFIATGLTQDEIDLWQQSKDINDIAFVAGDYNGDGITDYKVLSLRGAQVLYGVP